ncbi:MAG: exo-beta-N-acetylmuramidase NamZ domain-containing protein [Flavobacteriales bacterium]
MKISTDTLFYFVSQKYGKLGRLLQGPKKYPILFRFIAVFFMVWGLNASGLVYPTDTKPVHPGADRMSLYLDSLKGKRVAVVANQTSVIKGVHLVDTLRSQEINLVKIFAPEHGFRGEGDAGEHINSSNDERTGIPVVSLYGNHKKPTAADLMDVDIVVFDIQDVGVRFYTYLSTLHYVMEACAEFHKKLIILDRPNPNAHYVDGPVLETEYKSFVGMHPVPIVYGMTIGEYANMINGEFWLKDSLQCQFQVIPCKNYTHKSKYSLPIPPSPNLKSDLAISLYPSLCLFEATTISIGRGTSRPFEQYGHPRFPITGYSFVPKPQPGAKNPPHVDRICQGYDLSKTAQTRTYELNLFYLTNARDLLGDSAVFIDQNSFFNRLAGNSSLKEQLYKGWGPKEIRASWKPGLDQFLAIRKKYLIYR